MNIPEHDPNDVYRVLFVYGKGGRVKCLTMDEAKRDEAELLAGGWVHTSTIQPARWIESVVNDQWSAHDSMLDLLHGVDRERPDVNFSNMLNQMFKDAKPVGKGVTLLSEIELDQMEKENTP